MCWLKEFRGFSESQPCLSIHTEAGLQEIGCIRIKTGFRRTPVCMGLMLPGAPSHRDIPVRRPVRQRVRTGPVSEITTVRLASRPKPGKAVYVIEEILPAAVSAVEAFDDPPGAVLFPEEAAVVAQAGENRRREFTTARSCAHQALMGLGVPPFPILPGERGAPRWPDGIVGGITHCAAYRAAAVARAHEILTVGIDAEPNDVLPDGVLHLISLQQERVMLAELAAI